MPGDVQGAVFFVEVIVFPPQQPMLPSELDEQPKKAAQVGVSFEEAPVYPTALVVLAVGIVVATLCPSKLVASQDHGGSSRQQEDRRKVPHLPPAQSVDLLGVG